MKLIPLTKGQFAQVDDEDYDYLMQWKWYAQHDKDKYYPTRGFFDKRINNISKVRMHNQIMNPSKGTIIDHIDRNPLNNQKNNLRTCTSIENSRNKSSKKNGTSKFLGVHWCSKKGKWVCQISINCKKIYLGEFSNEIEAAKSYDLKSKELFGEFANCNF